MSECSSDDLVHTIYSWEKIKGGSDETVICGAPEACGGEELEVGLQGGIWRVDVR